MARMLTLAAVLALLTAFPLCAQATGPVTPQMLNFGAGITTAIDNLVMSNSAAFVADARLLLHAIAVIMLIRKGFQWMYRPYGIWYTSVDIGDLVLFLGKLACCLLLLHFYINPLPGTSVRFPQLFTSTAYSIQKAIDLSVLTIFAQKANELTSNLFSPATWNLLEVWVYLFVLGMMILTQGVLFAVTILSFVATGIGSLLGPFFIPLLMIPSLAGKFWRWVDFMFVYSFYRVISAAFVYVWVHVMVDFFDNSVKGNYSASHIMALLVPFTLLQLAFVWSMFRVPAIAHELLGGGAGFGTSIGHAISGAATALIRR